MGRDQAEGQGSGSRNRKQDAGCRMQDHRDTGQGHMETKTPRQPEQDRQDLNILPVTSIRDD